MPIAIYLQPQQMAPAHTRLRTTGVIICQGMRVTKGSPLTLHAEMNFNAASIRTPDQSFSMLLIAKAQ